MTPTHYVAPYALVSGATSDEDTVNGTAYASATSLLTPCTLGEAFANAAAGDVIQAAPGVYTATPDSAERWIAAWSPGTSGTAGNEILLIAQYPAVQNIGSPELFSELRSTDYTQPVLNIESSHIIMDGFYFNQTLGNPSSDGSLQLHTCDNVSIRRWYFTLDDISLTGNNYCCWFLSDASNYSFQDCRWDGGSSSTGDTENVSVMTHYNSSGTIEHCELNSNNCGIFLKGPSTGGSPQFATIRYNLIKRAQWRGLEIARTDATTDIYQNIIISGNYCGAQFKQLAAGATPTNINFTNNTLIVESSYGGDEDAVLRISDALQVDGWNVHSNLIYAKASGTGHLVINQTDALTDAATFDYNHYYDESTPLWNNAGSNYATLADWQTATSVDTNSTYSDPIFVDAANDDYHLSGGSPALTSGLGGGPNGAYITGSEEIGVRANPTYVMANYYIVPAVRDALGRSQRPVQAEDSMAISIYRQCTILPTLGDYYCFKKETNDQPLIDYFDSEPNTIKVTRGVIMSNLNRLASMGFDRSGINGSTPTEEIERRVVNWLSDGTINSTLSEAF